MRLETPEAIRGSANHRREEDCIAAQMNYGSRPRRSRQHERTGAPVPDECARPHQARLLPVREAPAEEVDEHAGDRLLPLGDAIHRAVGADEVADVQAAFDISEI